MNLWRLSHRLRSITRLGSRGLTSISSNAGIPSSDDSAFFHHTTGRWLFNDTLQREALYTPFDVQALREIACQSVNAARCISFTKIAEGSANKIFLLRFDNGSEAVARIPSAALLGPTHAVTASEVATMDYLRRFCGVKTPKVLAWSNETHNPVGADYIVMERLPGVPLAQRWTSIEGEEVVQLLRDVATTEVSIGAKAFSQIGSLYFKDDVSPELQARPLFLYEEDNRSEAADLYRIGPSTHRLWWRGQRADVDVYRGPWPNMESQLDDAVQLARNLIQSDANIALRARDGLQTSDFLRLLDRCSVIPRHFALIPGNRPQLSEPVLRHPDLHLGNILVAADGPPQVQGYIDLQGALTAPRFVNYTIPPFAAYRGSLKSEPDGKPIKPAYYDELSQQDKDLVDIDLRLVRRQAVYVLVMCLKDQLRRFAQTNLHDLCSLVSELVEDVLLMPSGGRRSFQNVNDTVIGYSELWQEQLPEVPNPIEFSQDERVAHETREARITRYAEAYVDAVQRMRCSHDGWVRNEDYGKASGIVEELRKTWNEEDMGPFPFQDGSFAPALA